MKYSLFASAQPCPSSQLAAELPGVSLQAGPHLLTFHQNSFPAFTNLSSHKARTSADKSSWFTSAELSAAFIFSSKMSSTSLWCLSSVHSASESSPPLFCGLGMCYPSFPLPFFAAVPFLWLVFYPQVVLFSQVEFRSAFLLPACLCLPTLMSRFVFPFIFDGWL